MNELDKRLDKIEQQLSVISGNQSSVFGNPTSSRSDEIDLRDVFTILWRGKWWILGITFLFAVAGVSYALSLPNMYKSEGVYAPAQKDKGAAGMVGQLGGLASLAGVSLGGGESDDIDQAVELIASWPFMEGLITENGMEALVLGVDSWDSEKNQIVWDDEIFDGESWVANGGTPPTSYSLYRALKAMFDVRYDKKNGMLYISVEHYSPYVAREWVNLFVRQLNKSFRDRDMKDASRNITYLEQKISSTGLAEMQAVFYGMIEGQIKTLMLAEVNEEHLIREVVEPKVPELKSSPQRLLIMILFVLVGGVLSVVMIIGIGLFQRSN